MAGITAAAGIDLGIPDDVRARALAYLVIVLEDHHPDRLEEDTVALAEQVADLGALDVYVLPDQAGADLVTARERAFWASKANGADDLVDVVVPRASIPTYLETVAELAGTTNSLIVGCGHAGDGNVHLSVWQADPDVRRRLLHDLITTGVDLGGAISGEHGIGTLKRRFLSRAGGPGQARPDAADQVGLRPPRHPQSGHRLRCRRAGPERSRPVNGAQSLIRTLVGHGVDTCFMNPGTSEMHFVAALDEVTGMHGVLALFEGVATGAADGYARMAGRPAATLLHLGPGLGNGLANLHNARRAHSPVVNIVGDHAIGHRRLRRPAPVGHRDGGPQRVDLRPHRRVDPGPRSSTPPPRWLPPSARRARWPPSSSRPTCPGPTVGWWPTPTGPTGPSAGGAGAAPDESTLHAAAAALRSGEPAVVLIGGRACRGTALDRAADMAAATGARLLAETFPARLERGAGRPPVERLAYLAEFTAMQLEGVRHLVLLDAASPVSFFAYPGKASDLVPAGCTVHAVAGPADDVRRRAGRTGRRWWVRRRGPPPGPPPRPPASRPARSPPSRCARPSAPSSPREPSSPTRGTPRGCSPPGPRPARPRTTGSA